LTFALIGCTIAKVVIDENRCGGSNICR
jgi:hypothetical protein